MTTYPLRNSAFCGPVPLFLLFLSGYTNEVGESFRSLISVHLVNLSYAVAFGYCLADTIDKTIKRKKVSACEHTYYFPVNRVAFRQISLMTEQITVWKRWKRGIRAGVQSCHEIACLLMGFSSELTASCPYPVSPQDLPIQDPRRKTRIIITAGDTLIWQLLASVLIPGFTINRICFASNILLRRYTTMHCTRRNIVTTAAGLSSIPLIVRPIDHLVDWFMDSTCRKIYIKD